MNGANGKMGRALSAGLARCEDIAVVAAVDIRENSVDYGLLCAGEIWGFGVEPDLDKAITRTLPDVVVDFTNPQAVMKNIAISLARKVPIVAGTTGFGSTDLEQVAAWSKEYDTPVFIAPNFALGAVLMMRFAKEASAYFPHVEVIELHHDQKLDAPSGTAVKTLQDISEVRQPMTQGAEHEFEKIGGSRGGNYQGMHVHSVRLPGYVASQEVIFGGLGQVLTIRHDATSRETYVPGVAMAVRRIKSLRGLVCGLENLL